MGIFFKRGAEHTFFKFGLNSGYTWFTTARMIVYGFVGILAINQITRGNIWGEVSETSEVYIPLLAHPEQRFRRHPATDSGFVGDDDETSTSKKQR